MAEIKIFLSRSCLASKPNAAQWKWKQERDEKSLEFHPSVGGIWSLQGSLDPAAALVLWQHVPSCDSWTWIIELLAQKTRTW